MPEPFLLTVAAIALAATSAAGWISAERRAQRLMADLQGLLDCAERGPHD